MRLLFVYLSFLLGLTVTAQKVKVTFIKSIPLKADAYYGTDTFENIYYNINDVLYKKTPKKTYQYNNLALGKINSISLFNPLELVVFYKDFNNVIILDNTLNEIQKLSFIDKNISSVAKASKNNLWLYNTDAQQLELYNYKTKTVLAKSQPQSLLDPKAMQGHANFVWVKTKDNTLKVFNNYGSEINTIDKNIEVFAINKLGDVIFKSDNSLYLKSKTIEEINLNKNLDIKNISVIDNKLYIFNGKAIFIFKFLKI